MFQVLISKIISIILHFRKRVSAVLCRLMKQNTVFSETFITSKKNDYTVQYTQQSHTFTEFLTNNDNKMCGKANQ